MSRSADPGHFFQTSASLSEAARKDAKATNTSGNPIKLASKLLALAPDPDDNEGAAGGRVYVAEAGGTVRRIVIETGEVSAVYSGPTAPLTSLALSPSTTQRPRTLFAGCWDKSIWSWDVATRKPKQRYVGHGDFVKAVLCFAVHGRELLVSGSQDASIIVWDVESGRQLHRLKGHTRGILALALDPLSVPEDAAAAAATATNEDATVTVYSAGSDREIRRWRIGVNSAQEMVSDHEAGSVPILAHETSVNALRFDADGDMWTASADKTAKCLVRDRNWEVDADYPHPDFVKDVVVDEVGGWVVTACRDEEVRVWERGSGKLHHVFSGHFEEVTALALLPGQKLVSVSIDGTLRTWSLGQRELARAVEEAEKAKRGEVEEKEEKKESLLTEEEERELAELMEDSD